MIGYSVISYSYVSISELINCRYICTSGICIRSYTTINIFCSCTARVVVRSYIRAILAALCFIGVLSHSQPALNEKWVAPPPIKLWLIIDPLITL
jgi:hypothetical protein